MMKSFRTIVSEVAQPRGPEEKKFKDMHSYETKSHPVAPDAVFTGAIGADDLPKVKAKRKADQEGDVNYDKQFKEELDLEINEDLTMVSRQPHPKGGHIVTLIDKNGKKVVRHLNNGKVKDIKNVKDMKSEETQLDELSPKTMKSYAKKADASIAKAVDTMKGRASRGWAVDNDSNYDTIKKRMQGKASLTRKKVMKRDGFSNARPASRYEEVEQVNELDKKTLGSYIKKAGPDAVKQTAQAKRHADAGDMSDKDADMYKNYAKSQRAMDKAKNRQKGIGKAVDKLTKESVEPDLYEALDKYLGTDKRKSHYTSVKHAYRPKHTNTGNDSYDPKKVETQAHLQHAQDFHDRETDKGMDRYHTTHLTVPHHEAQVGHLHKAMKANAKGDKAGLEKHMKAYHHGNENHKINKTGTYTHAHHLPHHGESKDVKEEVNETTMSAVKKPVTVTGPDGRTRTVMKTTKNKRTDDFGQDVIRAEDKAEVNTMVKAALGGKTKMKESVLNMFASKLRGDSE